MPAKSAHASPSIAGYTGLKPLAEGGFGAVYAAAREVDGAAAVLKVALTQGDPQFAREAQALRRLPAGVAPKLFEEGLTGDSRPYLAMERLEGRTLADWLAAQPGSGAAALSEARPIFAQLCQVVDLTHRAGVVHRDLKPENVFLRADGTVALLDFGLAQFAQDSATADLPGERPGSVEYMAPEQCSGIRPLTLGADLYAVGVMLFELLTGRPPFVGQRSQIEQGHVSRRPARPSAVAATGGRVLAAAVDEVVLRCLAKQPTDRFATATEIDAALSEALAREAVSPRRPSATQAGRLRSRTSTIALCGVKTGAAPGTVAHALGDAGTLLRATGEHCVIGFPLEPSPTHGVRAALAFAARLPQWAELAVIHCAEVLVREGVRRTTLAGDAIENFAGWWPAKVEGTPRILVSSAAAALLGAAATELSAVPGFLTPSSQAQQKPQEQVGLHGRNEMVDAMVADAAACIGERTPHLVTLVGDTGVGRSRLLEELARRLSGNVTLIKPASPEAGLKQLVGLAFGLDTETCSVEQVREACSRRVGAAAEQAWPAVAFALGLLAEDHEAVKPIAAAPGALRHLVTLAVGRGLCAEALTGPVHLLLDDAQLADPTTLDALELATSTAESVPLWVCVATAPGLLERRASWGERARHAVRHVIKPLDELAARALLAELLQPVEHVPSAVMAHLLASTRGVPLFMVEVVNTLRATGAIRLQLGTNNWYVAADELLSASATPVGDQLALKAVEGLPAPLLALARLCAVMGEQVEPVELDAVQQSLEGSGAGGLEARVGLARLVRSGLMRGTDGAAFAFRHPMLRDAVERMMPAEVRVALHEAVRKWLSATPDAPGARMRLAHHASSSGAHQQAATIYLALGEETRRRHRYLDAEQYFSSALAHVSPDDGAARQQALHGRGAVRLRMNRLQEALDDLRAARVLAERSGQLRSVLALRLEEGEALDWLQDFEASAELTRGSTAVAEKVDDPLLRCQLLMAQGRSLYRRELYEEALPLLSEAVRTATALGDHETQAVSLLMLPLALVHHGRLDDQRRVAEATQRFEEVIALCERAGDRLRLGAAFGNRILLWQGAHPERAEADLRRALEIAREMGHAQMERITQFNLAELLFWSDNLDEALRGARRAREIQDRYYAEATPDDTLLLARIQLARGDVRDARALLEWLQQHCEEKAFQPGHQVLRALTSLQLDPPGAEVVVERWRALVTEARAKGFGSDALVEILYAAAQAALASGASEEATRLLKEAAEAGGPVTRWKPRLAALEARLKPQRA